MSLAEKFFKSAEKEGKVNDGSKYFSVTDKKTILAEGEDVIIEKPNGNHIVKVISEEVAEGKDFNGKTVKQLQLTILDKHNGTSSQKIWNMPLTGQDGNLYFLIGKLKEIAYLDGEEFLVRAKKLPTGKYTKEIVRISKGESTDDIPTINLDEDDSDETVGRGEPKTTGADGEGDDLPF